MRIDRSVQLLTPLLVCAVLAGCGGRDADDRASAAPDTAPLPASATGTATTPPVAPAVTGAGSGAPADVRPLAGQSEAGVQALLGAPTACQDVPNGRRCTYARGGAEIVYIDGMADHIVIGDLGGAPFEAATIGRIGLAGAEPVESTDERIRWQSVGGMREIVLERGADGRASRFVIKAMTL